MGFRYHRSPPIRFCTLAAITLFAGAVVLPVEKGFAQRIEAPKLQVPESSANSNLSRGTPENPRRAPSPSHGENRGSRPLGSANDFNYLAVLD